MPEDQVPRWVPRVAPGLHADVYPVSPPQTSVNPNPSPPAELRLDRHAVIHGYAERRLPYEFSSCLSSTDRSLISSLPDSTPPSFNMTDLAKLRDGLTNLRRSRPTILQRVELTTFTSSPSGLAQSHKKSFPLQKPSTSSLDDWLDKLSSPSSVPTSTLARSVPLGPAIVRAAGKVIEMMASRSVPTQRAVWYIRIAVLNECVKHMRPDRPAIPPRIFWTRPLAILLRNDMESIRGRRTAALGFLDRVTFWRYLLDLVRWQADEGLLDLSHWLKAIADVLKSELINAQTFSAPGTSIAMMTARRFLPEFIADVDNARLLCSSLLPGGNVIVQAWRTSCQSREVIKGAKGMQRKSAKRTFVANACHAEVTFLLSATLRVLDASVAQSGTELRLSDLERFVKRGDEIVDPSSESKKSGRHGPKAIAAPRRQQAPADVHRVTRECEMLPAHGDVASVISVVRSISKDGVGTAQKAVKTVCHWALVGPVNDRAEAIAIAGALLTNLSDSLRTPPPSSKKTVRPVPVPRRGKKVINEQRSSTGLNYAGSTSGADSTPKDPPLQRELWHFLKDLSQSREVGTLDKEDHVVRFLAHVCRLDLLSLPTFVRDVSRLSSCNHLGSAYLVKCLTLLPDPKDRSVADTRRSLLRKFGHLSTSRAHLFQGVEEEALIAACSGDMSLMEAKAQSLMASGKTNVVLSTSEAVLLEDVSKLSDDALITSKKLFTMISFLLHVEEPGMAVEWLLDNLGEIVDGGAEWKTDAKVVKRKEIMSILTRLVGDLSRYIAACGHLESVFALLKKGYVSTWVTSNIRTQILHTLASLTCTYGAGSENGSMYWTKMVIRVMRQSAEASKSSAMIQLAVASLRGRQALLAEDKSMADILDVNNRRNWGLSPDDDLQMITNMSHCQGIDVPLLRERFSNGGLDTNGGLESPLESLFVRGLSANDIIGCIFIPVLSEVLSESSADTSLENPFSKLARSVLHMIRRRQTDVRMQGVRPTLVIDLMALIIAGCVCVHMDPSESLEVLVRVRWIWKILAPRAGIKLAKRLRTRVDYYCDKTATTDKSELSALLSNMVTRVYADTGRDEIEVSSSIGVEPFGMIEMQLALLAVHRRECGEDDEFGSNVSEAPYVDRDCAHSLTVTALQCCSFDDEYRQAMAGIMAYGAVREMAESLGYVLTGLTMEASKVKAVHQERAREWFEADRARCTALEYCVDGVSDEVGSQVETALFEQLMTVVSQLSNAMTSGCMPSDLLTGGQQLSDALESRLLSILWSKRTRQNVDIWRQRSVEVARLVKASIPLMKRSGIKACLDVLNMCIKNVGLDQAISGQTGSASLRGANENSLDGVSGIGGSGDKSKGGLSLPLTSKQILENMCNQDLKKQLQTCLSPTLFWAEPPEREAIAMIAGSDINAFSATGNTVEALDDSGAPVDNWILLEGYGRGVDEVCSVSPSTFWRQGEGRFADEERGRTVQLKRTYSTFASLAV